MTEIATSTLHPLPQERNIVKTATIKINGITAPMRISVLTEFIRLHELDILLARKVTHPETLNVRGYATHLNIGTSMRGTAILARNEITLTNIIKVPSGRNMAATYNGLLIINVYFPSGTARRTDRESFYTSEQTCVPQAESHNVILGGDFNCVMHPVDTTDGDSPRFIPGRHMDTRPPST
jgi:exonuclease III